MELKTIVCQAATLGLLSCKYEEGPNLSLRSKKARVGVVWYWYEFIEEGKTHTATDYYKDLHWNFKENGDFILSRSQTTNEGGKRDFYSKKDSLLIDFGSRFKVAYKIVKLKNHEMWLNSKITSGYIQLHFKPLEK